jgi:hypothetical protein
MRTATGVDSRPDPLLSLLPNVTISGRGASSASASAEARGSTSRHFEHQAGLGPGDGSRRLSSPELSSRPKPAWLASP